MPTDAVAGPSRPPWTVEDLSALSREQPVAATLAHYESFGLSTVCPPSAALEHLTDEFPRAQSAKFKGAEP